MSPIRTEIKEHIATVTIDFPPVNAMSRAQYGEMTEIFDSLWDSEARVAVLTGAGERAFCAGADVKDRAAGGKDDHGRAARECYNSIYECPVPVIGAINGPALGAGMATAASCDYLIASERASFGLPEIDVGLMGGAKHLSRFFPQGYVRRMHYTADRANAQEAYRLGAVTAVVPPDQLMEEAMKDAALVASSPLAGDARRHPAGQGGAERHRVSGPQERLPVRADSDQHPHQDRGRHGSEKGVPGKAPSGLQGKMTALSQVAEKHPQTPSRGFKVSPAGMIYRRGTPPSTLAKGAPPLWTPFFSTLIMTEPFWRRPS